MDVSKLRFLVVDDSQMIRDVIVKLLADLVAGSVDTASDGEQALLQLQRAAAEQRAYTLMTLDWEMPRMSGLELLQRVRQDPALKNLPVLMVSTKADAGHLKELAPLQPNGFVVKPFGAEIFRERVLSLLKALNP